MDEEDNAVQMHEKGPSNADEKPWRPKDGEFSVPPTQDPNSNRDSIIGVGARFMLIVVSSSKPYIQ